MGFVHKTLAHQPIEKKNVPLFLLSRQSLSVPFLYSHDLMYHRGYITLSPLSHKGGSRKSEAHGPTLLWEGVMYLPNILIPFLSLFLSLSLFQWIYLSYKSAMMSVYTLYHKNNFTTKIWLFINFIHTFYIKKNFIYTIIIRVVNSINKVMRVNRLALFYCSNQQL